jgi:arginyl-tRNA synthetase
LVDAAEVDLGLHLARFSDVIDKVTEDLMPHHLTDYLYATSQKFNVFFRDCRVAGSDEESSRWWLCELTARVLSTGLSLLGIDNLLRM